MFFHSNELQARNKIAKFVDRQSNGKWRRKINLYFQMKRYEGYRASCLPKRALVLCLPSRVYTVTKAWDIILMLTKDKKLQRTGKLKKHAMFIMKHQLWKCPTCTWELSSFSYVPMEKLVLSESTKLKEDNKNRHSYPWWCRLIYYHKLFRFPKVENRILLYHNVFWGKRIKEIQQSSTHYTSISPPPPFL